MKLLSPSQISRVLLLLALVPVCAIDSHQESVPFRHTVTLNTGKEVPRVLAFGTFMAVIGLWDSKNAHEKQAHADLLALACTRQRVSNPISKQILQEYGLINDDGSAIRNPSIQAIMEAYYDCANQKVRRGHLFKDDSGDGDDEE